MPIFGKLSSKKTTENGLSSSTDSTKIATVIGSFVKSSGRKECKKTNKDDDDYDQTATTTKILSHREMAAVNRNGFSDGIQQHHTTADGRNGACGSSSPARAPTPPPPPESVMTIKGGNPMSSCPPPPPQDTKLVFHCQLAHGSPTGLLCGFSNVRELYERAAECFEIPFDDILYCTLNTQKVDMNHLLGGQIGLTDFIFVHVKGQRKEVEVVKDEPSLGVTITDNGAGKVFIKRIKPDSVVGRLSDIIRLGDHIERINEESMLGKKHFDVARRLRDLPVGATFTLRLIEPELSGPSPQARAMSSSCCSLSPPAHVVTVNRSRTLRFKARGTKAPIITDSAPSSVVIDRINAVLESYLGIHDSDLALTVWEMAKEPANSGNPVAFLSTFKRSELADFHLPDERIFDLWAATKEMLFQVGPSRRSGVPHPAADNDVDRTLTRPRSATVSVFK